VRIVYASSCFFTINHCYESSRKGNEEYTMKTMERTSTSKESTVKQILDLAAFVASVLVRLSFEQVKYLLGNKDTILRNVRYPIIKTAIPGNYFNFNLIDFLKQIHEETFLMQYEF